MSVEPQRIQLSRRRGFNLQAASLALNGLPAVKVDRTTMWGNRWRIGTHSNTLGRVIATAQEASDLYARLAWPEAHHRAWIRERLRGKNLACWCPLPAGDEPDHCHAHWLVCAANEDPFHA